ncbi:hypothetical protein D3C71_1958700 [compost metagenome]
MITTANRNNSVSHEVTGAPGILNATGLAFPALIALRSCIWQTIINAQEQMMPSEAIFSTISNTCDGTR